MWKGIKIRTFENYLDYNKPRNYYNKQITNQTWVTFSFLMTFDGNIIGSQLLIADSGLGVRNESEDSLKSSPRPFWHHTTLKPSVNFFSKSWAFFVQIISVRCVRILFGMANWLHKFPAKIYSNYGSWKTHKILYFGLTLLYVSDFIWISFVIFGFHCFL